MNTPGPEGLRGPLRDVRVVEFAGIGPSPFCAMLLADLGADVIRLERPEAVHGRPWTDGLMLRGRRSVPIDLKQAGAADTALRLVEQADAVLEGFRPGVMERFGLGPDVCLGRNERLVYGRMTGWGQTGPYAMRPGHDLNFIAASGALAAIGRKGDLPVPPLSLVGDFGGGGMFLAFGVLSAIINARATGVGQIVDAAIIEGSSMLMMPVHELLAQGEWTTERGSNLFDGGAPYNDVYATADGEVVAIACVEHRFYLELLRLLELDALELSAQMDRSSWPMIRAALTEAFAARTVAECEKLFDGAEVCFSVVVDVSLAPSHPQNHARQNFYKEDGILYPAPAPRFSQTPPNRPPGPRPSGTENHEALSAWGFSASEIDELSERGITRQAVDQIR